MRYKAYRESFRRVLKLLCDVTEILRFAQNDK